MQHVHLQLHTCEALFADPSTPETLIRLPNVKLFIYNCSRRTSKPIPKCSCIEKSITHAHPDLLWRSVTTSLEKLVATPDVIPKDAKVYAFMTSNIDRNDRSTWRTHICADMQSQYSLALPHRSVSMEGVIYGCTVIRLRDDSDWISTDANIEAIAEGQLWKEVFGGARLPAAMLADERKGKASFAVGCVEKDLGLETSQQWRKDNPQMSPSHWYNENLTGSRLLCAEERTGKYEYRSLRPIRESTPQGWKRGYEQWSVGKNRKLKGNLP